MKTQWFVGAMLAGLVSSVALGQEGMRAFVGGQILTVSGEVIENGVLLLRGTKIANVGPMDRVRIPAGIPVEDVSGKVLMPGLVDTHSHIGQVEGADRSAPIQPDVRVMDSINVRHPSLQRARAGGITTVNIMPGSGHLMSGQTLYVKLRDGEAIEDLFLFTPDGRIAGGMKMANGTNSRRDPPFPGTRAKSAALVREQFIKAQEYRDQIARAGEDSEKMPDRDLALEALVEVLEGKRVVHYHTHRHDDVLTIFRLQEEFGFRVVLHHVSDAWKIAAQIAAAGVPSSIILVDSPGGKLEARYLSFESGAALERAGAPVAFHTDDYITDSRLFLRQPALAVRAGMSRQAALEAVTLAAAKMLDLDDRIGSLQAGKDADFVILSGDPFSVYTRVLETWVEGVKVFDLDDEEDQLIAEGGYGAGSPRPEDLDCLVEAGGR